MNILVPKHYAREIEASFFPGIKGEYQIQVISPDGSISFPIGEQFHKNIITNIGLSRLITHSTRQYNYNYTASDTTYTETTVYCRVGSSATAAAAGDTQLGHQLLDPAPTYTFYTGTDANKTETASALTGVVTHKRTYQFAAVGPSGATINEIGLGWHPIDDNTLFSRFVTPSAIVLADGQILRVVYQLTVSAPQYATATSVSGLSSGVSPDIFNLAGTTPSAGIKLVGGVRQVFGLLNTAGGFSYDSSDYSSSGNLWTLVSQGESGGAEKGLGYYLSSDATFPTVGVDITASVIAGSGSQNRVSRSPDVDIVTNRYVDCVYEFTVSQPTNSASNVRAVIFRGMTYGGQLAAGNGSPTLALRFNSDQTKLDTHKLQIGLRSGWTRL